MALVDDLATNLQEDATRLTSAEKSTMVTLALKELSVDSPRIITREGIGDGSKIYPLVDSDTADPAVTGAVDDWDRGVSTPKEFQLQDSSGNWCSLDLENWRKDEEVFGSTTEEWLPALVLVDTLEATDTFRLVFTKAWAESDPELGGRLYVAALELATSKAHSAIASEYASMTDATLDADSVDQGSLSGRHFDLADGRMRNYRKLMGLQAAENDGGTAPGAASLQKDLVDFQPSWRGVSMRRGYNR